MAIPLPNSLKLTRDKEGERVLNTMTKAWLAKDPRTPGIHASNLLDPRLAYFEAKHGPRELDDKLACTFLIGKVLHAFVLSAQAGASGIDWATDTGSKTSKELGIQYSIDRFENGIPEELKTSRKPYEPRTVKDIDLYIEQVLIYMAAKNSCVGKITVLFLSLKDNKHQTSPGYRCYEVTISQEDLEKTKQFISTTVKRLDCAIANEAVPSYEFRALPLCRQFKCGPKNCPHWEECKPEGRYPRKTKGAWKA